VTFSKFTDEGLPGVRPYGRAVDEPLGRDHTHRSEPFANVAMILIAVELRIHQDQA
jgi:hypothetical protein